MQQSARRNLRMNCSTGARLLIYRSAESEMNEPNPKLMDVIFLALDHGIESVKSSGGPLIPFVITEGPNGNCIDLSLSNSRKR